MSGLRALVAFLLVIAVVVAALLLSGVYDVGADAPHWPWVERLAAATRNASIAARTRDLTPPDLNNPERVTKGAEHYSEMCVGCHGAPGVEDSELRKGLYPKPPDLGRAGPKDPGREFWVIKHGIKLSAMPAWGATHDDEAIWSIVAFLQKLPSLSTAQYQALTSKEDDRVRDRDHGHQGHPAHESAHTTNGAKH